MIQRYKLTPNKQKSRYYFLPMYLEIEGRVSRGFQNGKMYQSEETHTLIKKIS